MAHYRKSFPSKYLQSTDLDAPIVATIKRVHDESVGIGNDAVMKPVATFHEPGVKALVLNITKAATIAGLAGSEDTDAWPNTRVQLSRGMTLYKGKPVACIMVEAAPPRQPAPTRTMDPDDPLPGTQTPPGAADVGF